MEPIKFDGANVVYGAEQPEYIPLPAQRNPKTGVVLSCWKLTPQELKKIQETGVIWVEMLTFNQPLQPIRLDCEKPDISAE